ELERVSAVGEAAHAVEEEVVCGSGQHAKTAANGAKPVERVCHGNRDRNKAVKLVVQTAISGDVGAIDVRFDTGQPPSRLPVPAHGEAAERTADPHWDADSGADRNTKLVSEGIEANGTGGAQRGFLRLKATAGIDAHVPSAPIRVRRRSRRPHRQLGRKRGDCPDQRGQRECSQQELFHDRPQVSPQSVWRTDARHYPIEAVLAVSFAPRWMKFEAGGSPHRSGESPSLCWF